MKFYFIVFHRTMDKIFNKLENDIKKSPENIHEHIKNAKEELETMLSQKNYMIFENIIAHMNIVDHDE